MDQFLTLEDIDKNSEKQDQKPDSQNPQKHQKNENI